MFLAEWLVTGERVPVWDPALPMSLFDFGLNEASVLEPDDELDIMFLNRQLIFICQRELQRKIARMYSNDENLLWNAVLIMLFMLGFPFLCMVRVQNTEITVQESRSLSSSLNRDFSVDFSVHVWRLCTIIAPQDISLMIQVDLKNHTMSLILLHSTSDTNFIWQNWVDAAIIYVYSGSWQRYQAYYLSSITRPETRSLVERPSKCLSQYTGCRRLEFDFGEVVDWSLRCVFQTRIDFEGHHGEFFPVVFDPKLQLFSIRQLFGTASQKIVRFYQRNLGEVFQEQ